MRRMRLSIGKTEYKYLKIIILCRYTGMFHIHGRLERDGYTSPSAGHFH